MIDKIISVKYYAGSCSATIIILSQRSKSITSRQHVGSILVWNSVSLVSDDWLRLSGIEPIMINDHLQ